MNLISTLRVHQEPNIAVFGNQSLHPVLIPGAERCLGLFLTRSALLQPTLGLNLQHLHAAVCGVQKGAEEVAERARVSLAFFVEVPEEEPGLVELGFGSRCFHAPNIIALLVSGRSTDRTATA